MPYLFSNKSLPFCNLNCDCLDLMDFPTKRCVVQRYIFFSFYLVFLSISTLLWNKTIYAFRISTREHVCTRLHKQTYSDGFPSTNKIRLNRTVHVLSTNAASASCKKQKCSLNFEKTRLRRRGRRVNPPWPARLLGCLEEGGGFQSVHLNGA